MSYHHLNYLKHCQILALWKAGFNQTQEVASFVKEKLLEDWSPEQISGYAKRWQLFAISHERIYQYILENKTKGGILYTHLRHQNKRYRKRYGSPTRQYSIKNRVMIDERPAIVNEKCRIGDWEIDTIMGKNNQQAILSLVERKTKFTILRKLKEKTSASTKNAIVDALLVHKDRVHTITSDNGTEFTLHQVIATELDANFYFAHPYASWERGLNENTNGLVRQYIRKGCELTNVNEESLGHITRLLNNRPRKSLGYRTPREMFQCP